MMIAQHHGMPTRLLDWTESPLAALFFASERMETQERDSVVYAINKKEIKAITTEIERERVWNLSEVMLYKGRHLAPRQIAQRGLFTVHNEPEKPWLPPRMTKIVIPKICCGKFKSILDVCAINRATLFPDIDGVAASLTWRHKWDMPM